jgi:hypothetical protein
MNEYKNMLTQYNNVKCKVSTKNTPLWHTTEDEKSVTKLLKHIFRKLALDFDVFSYLYFTSIAFWGLSGQDLMIFFYMTALLYIITYCKKATKMRLLTIITGSFVHSEFFLFFLSPQG